LSENNFLDESNDLVGPSVRTVHNSMIILGPGVALTYEITTVDLFVAIPFYQLRNQSVLVKRANAEAIKKNDGVLTISWFRMFR
jgi:hypothetical protein